jgi:hypothetical protein
MGCDQPAHDIDAVRIERAMHGMIKEDRLRCFIATGRRIAWVSAILMGHTNGMLLVTPNA